ncbi:MAG: PQQ-binding-like beta-propeller repeat protein [Deltaproteobacteria bacterium]|nr:PQQ-binding-like beta-propeller repeat protein [Deltaproteobacteria bacterium]
MQSLRLASSVLALCLSMALAISAEADSWPQYRGPDRAGSTATPGVFPPEPFALEVAWKKKLGLGYSGVAIAEGRAVTLFADGDKDVIAAFDLEDGGELWRHVIADTFPSQGGSRGGPNATPVIADGMIYGFGPFGDLFALRLDSGALLWQRRLEETEAKAPFFGFSTAPLVAGELLIVETGGPEGHAISAFSRASGDTVWTVGDDEVTYQSPQIAHLAGRRQLIALTGTRLLALDPTSGSQLWSYEHGFDPAGASFVGLPLPLGEGGLLVNSPQEVAVVDVATSENGFEVSQRWRSRDFKRALGVPVMHQGYLYGMSGPFLTCLDVRDGSLAWRSRPPGGNDFSLVDGHLVVVGKSGDLVVSEANPKAYRERARLALFENRGWTAPSFADQRIVVRNEEELVAVRITGGEKSSASASKMPEPKVYLGEFGRLVQSLEELPRDQRAGRLDAYLTENSTWPLTEVDNDSGFAHVLYRGQGTDVAVQGNLTGVERELVLHRIDGTDLFYRSFELDPKGLWEYRLTIEFQDAVPDPANPATLEFGERTLSSLVMPEYTGNAHRPPITTDAPKGQIESFAFSSQVLDNERQITVYLPPSYRSEESRSYPLLVVNSDRNLPFLHLDHTLDQLIANRQLEPLVVAFVPQASFSEHRRGGVGNTTKMLVTELLPRLEKSYRLLKDPSRRGIMGIGSSAFLATWTALTTDGSFSRVATQSYFARDSQEEDVLNQIRDGAAKGMIFRIERRASDYRLPGGYPRAASTALTEALGKAGADVELLEAPGGAGISGWRSSQGRLLAALFPPED